MRIWITPSRRLQSQGQQIYNTVTSDTLTTCNGCHVVNPAQGRFGTDGTMAIEGAGVDEDFKIPHLRSMYQKVGMFAENTQTSSPFLGDQIRGFGFDNSGASGTISLFLGAPVFTLNATQRSQVEQFVLAMPSGVERDPLAVRVNPFSVIILPRRQTILGGMALAAILVGLGWLLGSGL